MLRARLVIAVLLCSMVVGMQPAGARSRYVMVDGVNAAGQHHLIPIDRNLVPAHLVMHGEKVLPQNVTPSGNLLRFGHGNSCWRYARYVNALNSVHLELWRLTMSRYWCGTYLPPYLFQVTRADRATAVPNQKGFGGAWDWKGLVESNTDLAGYFYSYPGNPNPHAGHAQYVTGMFQFCVGVPVIGSFCWKKYPHIWINVHYNGAVASGGNNAGTEQ